MPPNSKSRVKRPDRNRRAMADAIEIRTHSGALAERRRPAGDGSDGRASTQGRRS